MFIPNYRSGITELRKPFAGLTPHLPSWVSVRLLFSRLVTVAVIAVLLFTLFIMCSGLFGFRLATVWGTSMDPVLKNGDVLWTRAVSVQELQPGDIITLGCGTDYITHRLITVNPDPEHGFLLETKGDANTSPEYWRMSHDGKALLTIMRIPFTGYLLQFTGTITGKIVFLLGILIVLYGLLRYNRYRKNAQVFQEI